MTQRRMLALLALLITPLALAGPPKGKSTSAPPGYVKVKAGTFQMGSPLDEPGRYPNEQPHPVRLTRSFWLKATEVTRGEWKALIGTNPSRFASCGDDCPVEGVSWYDAIAYVNALSRRENLPECYVLSGCLGTVGGGCTNWSEGSCRGDFACSDVTFSGTRCTGYRLPTEAEWEYAARGGSTTPLYTGRITLHGDEAPELDPIGWYAANSAAAYDGAFDCSEWKKLPPSTSRCGPQTVGKKAPNGWGAYDMLGGVWEWCGDWAGDYSGRATDPIGPPSGDRRVYRGGSWAAWARDLRAANRFSVVPEYRFHHVGLRPIRSIR